MSEISFLYQQITVTFVYLSDASFTLEDFKILGMSHLHVHENFISLIFKTFLLNYGLINERTI